VLSYKKKENCCSHLHLINDNKNVTKTSRLRYAGHMIRRPEDLPQNPLEGEIMEGRNPGGRMG
jgi:hypothetical protein